MTYPGPGSQSGPLARAIIRPATESDAGQVADVYLASRKTFMPYAPLAHPDDAVRLWMIHQVVASGRVSIAVTGKEQPTVVGMMAISRREEVGWVDHLYLHPDHVGRGLGSRFVDLAKSSLGSPIRLYTFQENAKGRRFYERHGFVPIVFGDGSGNEEGCPDVLFEWRETT